MDGQLGYETINDSVPHSISSREQHKDAENGSNIMKPEGEHLVGGQHNEFFKASKVTSLVAGGMMSCAIDQCGVLWMWGRCPLSTSEGNKQSSTLSICQTPQPVAGLQGLIVVKVACGNEHVLAVVDRQGLCEKSTGQCICYAWGTNKYGQLGLGNRESRLYPEHVKALDEQNVGTLIDISCGAYHSAALTQSDRVGQAASFNRESMCWTFGMGENGQLGHGNSQSLALPEMVQSLPEYEKLVAVSCGLFHMGVVTEAGGVWTWGMERGLGLCPGIGPPGIGAGDSMSPVRVTGNHNFDTSHGKGLACGAAHTVLAVNDGSALWAWGRGQNGVLGTGQLVDSLTPCAVVWPPLIEAAAGSTEPDSGLGRGRSSCHDHLLKDAFSEADSGAAHSEKMLALAQREICTLTTELAAARQHAALLHAALYGPPESSNANSTWGILQEWDRTIAESSYDDLVRLHDFYRQARSKVKEVLLQKKVEKLCSHFMEALKGGAKDFTN